MDEDEASRISSLDLYEDLLLNDTKQPGRCLTIQEVNNEKQKLEEENRMLHQELTQATTSLSSLQKQHEVLRENFKSLLETAKRELERKDKVISDLTTADHPRVKPHYRDQLRSKKSVTKSSSLKGVRIDDHGNQTNRESGLHAKEKAYSHEVMTSGDTVLHQEITDQTTKVQSFNYKNQHNTNKNIKEPQLFSRKSSFTPLQPDSNRSVYKDDKSNNRQRLENRRDPRSSSRSSKRGSSPSFHRSRSRRSEEGESYHRHEKRRKSHNRSRSSNRKQSSVKEDLRDNHRLNRKSCSDNSSIHLVDKSLPLRRSADSSTDPLRNSLQLLPTDTKLDNRKYSTQIETGIMRSKDSVRSHRNKEVNSSKQSRKSSDRYWESRDSNQSPSITDVTIKPTKKSSGGNSTQNPDLKQQSSNFTPRHSATSLTTTKKPDKPIANDPLKSVTDHDELETLMAKTASIVSDNDFSVKQTSVADRNPSQQSRETKQLVGEKIGLPTTRDVRLSTEQNKISNSVDQKRSSDKSLAHKSLPLTNDPSVSRKRKPSETKQNAEKLQKASSSEINKRLSASSNDEMPRNEQCKRFEHCNKLSTNIDCNLRSGSKSDHRSYCKTSVATPIDATETEDKLLPKSLPLRPPPLKSITTSSLPDQTTGRKSSSSSATASKSSKAAVTSGPPSNTFSYEPNQKSAASTTLPQCTSSVTTITNFVPSVTDLPPRKTAVKAKLRKKKASMRLSSTSSDLDESLTPKDSMPHSIRSPLKKLSSKISAPKCGSQLSPCRAPASNQRKRFSHEDSDNQKRSITNRDSSTNRLGSLNVAHMKKRRKPQNRSSAFFPVLSSSSSSECNEDPVVMGLRCGQTCSLTVGKLIHADAQSFVDQVDKVSDDNGLSSGKMLLSPKKKTVLPVAPLKKNFTSLDETGLVASTPSTSSQIKASSPTLTVEVPSMTSLEKVSSDSEALLTTSSKSKTLLDTARSLQDQTFSASSLLDKASSSQDPAQSLTLHENASPTTSSCHNVQSYKDEPRQSFMYYYRIASLQYLLHLAKQLLAKHKSTNKDSSRLLWMKSLNECQIRRRLNSRWLSEREPKSAPDLSVVPATTSSHFPDVCVTSSMTSSSWMHHEESMQNFFEGLMKVITPLKSLKKNTSEHSVVHASDSVRRKILQSPNK